MGFKDDCEKAVRDIVKTPFNARSGREVPTSESIVQRDGAVWLTAAYLYADMADSTGMAEKFQATDAAKIIRAYLHAVTRVLKDRGGAIRSFDGDRVMAIFVGENAADNAVDAALRVNWVVSNIVHDELLTHNSAYFKEYVESDWRVRHRTGIDIGTAFIVRAGVRGDNDLVSIGSPPNVAAKLSDYKGGGRTIITDDVYDQLSYEHQYSSGSDPAGELKSIWTESNFVDIGGTFEFVRTSTWWKAYR